MTAKISSSYQITLPNSMRKNFQMNAGDEVDIIETSEGILVKKAMTREEKVRQAFADLDEWRENLPDKVKENIKKYAGWTASQHREYIDNLPEMKLQMREKYNA